MKHPYETPPMKHPLFHRYETPLVSYPCFSGRAHISRRLAGLAASAVPRDRSVGTHAETRSIRGSPCRSAKHPRAPEGLSPFKCSTLARRGADDRNAWNRKRLESETLGTGNAWNRKRLEPKTEPETFLATRNETKRTEATLAVKQLPPFV